MDEKCREIQAQQGRGFAQRDAWASPVPDSASPVHTALVVSASARSALCHGNAEQRQQRGRRKMPLSPQPGDRAPWRSIASMNDAHGEITIVAIALLVR